MKVKYVHEETLFDRSWWVWFKIHNQICEKKYSIPNWEFKIQPNKNK